MPGEGRPGPERVAAELEESAAVKLALASQASVVVRIAQVWAEAIGRGNKVLFCGNGGSAADSQHIAAELVGLFARRDRPAWPGLALSTDTSVLTAVANDMGFEAVFERQVEACGRPGDVLVGLSTSGESANVLRALEKASHMGLRTVALTGPGGRLKEIADLAVCVGSVSTPRIQEAHITVGHIICGLVEDLLLAER